MHGCKQIKYVDETGKMNGMCVKLYTGYLQVHWE